MKKKLFLSLNVDMETVLKCMNSGILNTDYNSVYVLTAWGETNLAILQSPAACRWTANKGTVLSTKSQDICFHTLVIFVKIATFNSSGHHVFF
jgi:hypothetical protein